MASILDLLLAFLLVVAGTAEYNCQEGCPLSNDLVCGDNGLTFMGDCLAVCAGVNVVHRGACLPPFQAKAAATASAEEIVQLAQAQNLSKHAYAREWVHQM